MRMRNEKAIGIFIFIAGLIILLGKLGVFGFIGRHFWPLLILLPGIALHALYYARLTPSWSLVPAGTLTVYGLLFGITNTWGSGLMSNLWPAFCLELPLVCLNMHWLIIEDLQWYFRLHWAWVSFQLFYLDLHCFTPVLSTFWQ